MTLRDDGGCHDTDSAIRTSSAGIPCIALRMRESLTLRDDGGCHDTRSAIRTSSAGIPRIALRVRESLTLRDDGGCHDTSSAIRTNSAGIPRIALRVRESLTLSHGRGPRAPRARARGDQTPRVERQSSRRFSCSTGSGTGSDTSRRLV